MSERLPRFIQPMLLTSTNELPHHDGWALEIKSDGMRAQLRSDGRRVTVRSRPGRDCRDEFPELSALGDVLDDPILLDGELVCFDPRGLPDFERLRSRLRARTPASVNAAQAAAPATLIVFDVLRLSGRSTRRLPYAAPRAARGAAPRRAGVADASHVRDRRGPGDRHPRPTPGGHRRQTT